MKAVLICPGEDSKPAFLAAAQPLATVPFLGQNLLEYWLSHLARSGAESVLVAVSDHPDRVRELVEDGSRWGLEVRVTEESLQLTPAEASLKFAADLNPASPQNVVAVLNHFPGLADHRLLNGPSEFMDALLDWMPQALTPDRVGMRQLRPGVWAGVNSSVSPTAKLQAPCWLGQHVLVGSEATIGPGTVIEEGVMIEPLAEVEASWIGPRTFVGQFTRIQKSITWGNHVVNWQTGAATTVPDPFVLCALDHLRGQGGKRWLTRLAELYGRNKDRSPLLMERPHTA